MVLKRYGKLLWAALLFWGQTGFADHLTIGSGAQIGAQSGLMRNVEPGAIMMGYPAVGIKDFMRQTAYLQKAANGDRNDKK